MIKILTLEDTKKLLKMDEVIAAVEMGYREKVTGDAVVFPMVSHEFDPGRADMDIKSGDVKGLSAFGLKMVAWFGDNPEKGLPALTGVVMVFDDRTGMPIGLINAGHLTGMRTGAAGAVGIKYLSRKNSETMLMVGAGAQALYQVRAALTVRPGLKRILVYDPMGTAFAESFAKRIGEFLGEAELLGEHFPEVVFEPVRSAGEDAAGAVITLEQAVGESDIIVTATPSKKPIIMKEWVKPGTHFSCMGSDMPGKQEIDERIAAEALLIADDRTQCLEVGEMETAYKKGLITENSIAAEIGEIIVGQEMGRTAETDITVFDSTGISLQDISAGALAFRKAEEMNIGQEIAF